MGGRLIISIKINNIIVTWIGKLTIEKFSLLPVVEAISCNYLPEKSNLRSFDFLYSVFFFFSNYFFPDFFFLFCFFLGIYQVMGLF